MSEFTLQPASSATLGDVFRLPASMTAGQTLYVFVRAVPHDPATGASLMQTDAEPWNNALMMRSSVTVDNSACR